MDFTAKFRRYSLPKLSYKNPQNRAILGLKMNDIAHASNFQIVAGDYSQLLRSFTDVRSTGTTTEVSWDASDSKLGTDTMT